MGDQGGWDNLHWDGEGMKKVDGRLFSGAEVEGSCQLSPKELIECRNRRKFWPNVGGRGGAAGGGS